MGNSLVPISMDLWHANKLVAVWTDQSSSHLPFKMHAYLLRCLHIHLHNRLDKAIFQTWNASRAHRQEEVEHPAFVAHEIGASVVCVPRIDPRWPGGTQLFERRTLLDHL